MYVKVILPKVNNIKILKAKLIVASINKVTTKKIEREKLLSSVIKAINDT